MVADQKVGGSIPPRCTKGEVPEWPNGMVSKTIGGDPFASSNLALTALKNFEMENIILVSVACLFREYRGKRQWFVAKQEKDSEWELPRIVARKAESSARAGIRMMGEQMGITVQVLEEAGRAGGVIRVNGKSVPQRHLYYLMIQRDASGEVLAFADHEWLPYAKAVRRLPAKRDRQMLKAARAELKVWLRKEANKPE